MRALFTFLLLSFFISAPFISLGQVADPASIPVFVADGPITVDGMLNESTWAVPAPHLKFKIGAEPSGFSNTPTGHAIVKEPYTDVSTCYVRFLRNGTDLYISLDSDDKQVCRFDWEGDGLFMKVKNSAGSDVEFKVYVGAAGQFVYEGPEESFGVGVAKPGTTIYDSTDVDNGYSAELKINLAALGFTTSTTSIQVLMNIFDPDNFSIGVPAWGPNGNYAKQWWGSEWGPVMRELQLSNSIVPVELTSFSGYYHGNSAKLAWSTATELNNRGFEIERSINNAEFTAVAFVKGQGTTTASHSYAYTDGSLLPNTSYSYRLKQVDLDGRFNYSNIIELGATHPAEYLLGQNYPNPFNPATKISFSLPVKSNVTLDVYNLIGQKILELVNGSMETGTHQVDINAAGIPSGVYIYILKASGDNGASFTSSKKMTLLK
jgi:hypothetical protein